VEVVQGEDTDPEVVRRTIELLERLGTAPVHVRKDVAGFVGNRLQHALWREAFNLIDAGVCDARTVDVVIKEGFRPAARRARPRRERRPHRARPHAVHPRLGAAAAGPAGRAKRRPAAARRRRPAWRDRAG
jgi:hypothetical protein